MQRLAAGIVATLGLLASPVVAAEHSIRPDGLGDFATIQAAVDSATAGDTIFLENGVFTGAGNRDVRFGGKDLVVKSRHGPGACVIDCEGSSSDPHRAFRLDAGETQASRIEGITITGGFAEGPFPESGGGGILVADGSHPTISYCIFDGNQTGFEGFGAGLLAWNDCDITLTDCTFVNGVSGWYGGGFVLRKFCDAVVARCVVVDNYALHAGGGASITNSNPVVTDCEFSRNWVTEAGGGGVLVKAWAEPTFVRCVFFGNISWSGSGLGLGNEPHVTAIDCLFEANVAEWGGGGGVGLDRDPCSIILQNCTFVNNRAPSDGQHLFINETATATVRNTIFHGGCDALNPAHVEDLATFDVDCSLVEGGAAAISGDGTLLYGPDNFDSDPRFCDPGTCEATEPIGEYTLDAGSPAAPGAGSCGLVGAYPVACGVTSAAAGMTVDSWARIKARYSGAGRVGRP
jgi:hypothetical protein